MAEYVRVGLDPPSKYRSGPKRGEWRCRRWRLRWLDPLNPGRYAYEIIGQRGGPPMTKREALQYRQAKEQAINRGECSASPPDRMMLAEVRDRWDTDRKGRKVSASTMRQRRAMLKRLVGVCSERAVLSKISKRQIEAVRERLAALDPNTCATYERQLAALFHWGERERVIDMAANPVGGCGGDYQPSEKHRPLEAAEVSAIMAVAEGWDRVWAMISWASGLRPSAILHLRWESLALDLDPALIRVRPVNPGQWVTVGGVEYPLLAFRVGSGAKNANTYRDYPLPPVAVDVLRRWKVRAGGSPYVLLSLSRLRRLTAGARLGNYPTEPMYGVGERFRKLQVKASMWAAVPGVHWGPPTTPHSWRVTYTKTLEAARISPYVIDALSGRSSRGNVTAHHYAKTTPEELRQAADALQAAAVAGGFAEAELGSVAVTFV